MRPGRDARQGTAPPRMAARLSFPVMRSHAFDLPLDDHALRVRTLTSADPAATRRPTLVFLHDSLGSIRLWRDFPERLAAAAGCHALVYDRRGYGESSPFAPEPRTPAYLEREAEPLRRVLDGCGVREAVLFGHSDGGTIALVAATRDPERVRGVISEGAHVFVEELTLAGIRDAREALRTTDLAARLARYHGEKTAGVTAAWIHTWLSPAFRGWSIEPLLPAVRCPVLALQGEADEYGTPAQVDAIVRGVGGPARGWLVPGVGHTPHRDATEVVLQAALEFLRADVHHHAP